MNLGQRSPDLDKRGKTETSGNIDHWKDHLTPAAAFRSVRAPRTFRTWTPTLKRNLAAATFSISTSGVLLRSSSQLDIRCDSGIPCSPRSTSVLLPLL